MNPKHLTIILVLLAQISFAQDINYARALIDTLSSPSMDGRGYVNDGDRKAAAFLSAEFGKMGLLSFTPGYQQRYAFPMNTLPGKVEASANGKKLNPGSCFQVWAATPDIKGTFKVVALTPKILLDEKKLKKFSSRDYSRKFVLIDKNGITDKKALAVLDSLKYYNFLHARGLIYVSDTKLTWSVMIGFRARDYAVIDVMRDALPAKLKSFSLEVESEFVSNHKTANVIGWIKGEVQPDTFLVFTAHYDHLGRMGKDVYFPGANDNASGTAMVTDLARHYSTSG